MGQHKRSKSHANRHPGGIAMQAPQDLGFRTAPNNASVLSSLMARGALPASGAYGNAAAAWDEGHRGVTSGARSQEGRQPGEAGRSAILQHRLRKNVIGL